MTIHFSGLKHSKTSLTGHTRHPRRERGAASSKASMTKPLTSEQEELQRIRAQIYSDLRSSEARRHQKVVMQVARLHSKTWPNPLKQLWNFTRHKLKVAPLLGNGFYDGFYQASRRQMQLSAFTINPETGGLVKQSPKDVERVIDHELGHFLDFLPWTIRKTLERGFNPRTSRFISNQGFAEMLSGFIGFNTLLSRHPNIMEVYSQERFQAEKYLTQRGLPTNSHKNFISPEEVLAFSHMMRYQTPSDRRTLETHNHVLPGIRPYARPSDMDEVAYGTLQFFPETTERLGVLTRVVLNPFAPDDPAETFEQMPGITQDALASQTDSPASELTSSSNPARKDLGEQK